MATMTDTATTAVISTTWPSLQCARSASNSSSVTVFGCDAAAIAKSSATRSAGVYSGLVAYSQTASSFFSSTPSRSDAPAVCAIQ